MSGRGAVNCSGANGHYGFQAARAIEISYLGTANNFVGNVVGSVQMQSLKGYNYPLAQQASIEFPSKRSYDAAAYGWSFGYGRTGDDGVESGCAGGAPPCHASEQPPLTLSRNYNNIGASLAWAPGVTHRLPPSFYLTRRPAWWGSMPFPATGPDVTGGNGPGGQSYGNPAQACYLHAMAGSDGGAGGPLSFSASRCYAAEPLPGRLPLGQ